MARINRFRFVGINSCWLTLIMTSVCLAHDTFMRLYQAYWTRIAVSLSAWSLIVRVCYLRGLFFVANGLMDLISRQKIMLRQSFNYVDLSFEIDDVICSWTPNLEIWRQFSYITMEISLFIWRNFALNIKWHYVHD